MKKKFKLTITIMLMVIGLMGCGSVPTENETLNTSMFVVIEYGEYWDVVYHKDTKVMYAVSSWGDGKGVFSLLVDADGKPLLYEEN